MASTLLLGLRVALLVAAIGAVAGGVVAARLRDQGATDAAAAYACPMHPEVTSGAPGSCPVCGMQLERLRDGDGSGVASIHASTYLNFDVVRRRGTGPDAPAPAWVADDGDVVATLYDDEIVGIAADARGTFSTFEEPHVERGVRAVAGTRTAWDSSTSRLHFRADAESASGGGLRPGQVGWLRLVDRGREQPVIANSAILYGPDGPYVLVASPNGLAARTIQMGKTFGGLTFVLGGVRAREQLVTRSAFFADAERKLSGQATVQVTP